MVTPADALGAVAILIVIASVGLVARLERARSGRRWLALARERFLLGVPWGTLVVVAFVLAFYLFVQGGRTEWHRPVTIPYRAWSYYYPLGVATASFAHDNAGHLLGNLIGTIVVAPIAEYAWGHYPNGRDADASPWSLRPTLRAFVVFPLAVIALGVFTSLFAVGPVIGFSGVVYAFAGFAIVRYPIATLLATTLVQSAALTVYRAIQQPIYSVTVAPRGPSPPGWAMTAIQGHALGFFLGFVVAVVVFGRRRNRPRPARLWVALLLFGFARGLWEIYWFRGGGTYVLYRALGVVVITGLAVVLTLAIIGSDRPALPARLRRWLASRRTPRTNRRILELGLSSTGLDDRSTRRIHDLFLGTWRGEAPRLRSTGRRGDRRYSIRSWVALALLVVVWILLELYWFRRSGTFVMYRVIGVLVTGLAVVLVLSVVSDRPTRRMSDLVPGKSRDETARSRRTNPDAHATKRSSIPATSRRQVAFLGALTVLALLAGPAIPVNSFHLDGDTLEGSETVTVGDYSVTYAEDVENELVSVVDVELFGETTSVETSGVIVTSAERDIWTNAVSEGQLAHSGQRTIQLGGPGWRESVTAIRRGWSVNGGGTAYQVWLVAGEDEPTHVFASGRATADLRLDGYNVSIVPQDGAFFIVLDDGVEGGPTPAARIPPDGESTSYEGVTFERDGRTIYGVVNDTRVPVATRERYN